MDKDLIIVESPHKAQTINKILGSRYLVKASAGHIRDLAKNDISVDLETFKPKYEIIADKKPLVADLKKAAAQAKNVIIASDPDREGEAIGWHLVAALGIKNYKRAEFHEITEKGIKEGLSNLRSLDNRLIAAQEARRVIDRFIGYGISPSLINHVDKAKSAGRTQTAALRIIIERENSINEFKPEDRFRIDLKLKQNESEFIATVVRKDGETKNTLNELADRSLAEKIKAYITGKKAVISLIEHKDAKSNPPLPFTTSKFQQAVTRLLNISSEDAMKIAQSLYEKGYITYMRTDSVRLSDEATFSAKKYIVSKYGEKFYEKHVGKNKDGAQDAHEAIRPADVFADVNLTGEELEVYKLIVNRFIASQMSPAVFDKTVITVKIGGVIATAQASILKFKGYKTVYDDEDDDSEKETILSGIKEGDALINEIILKEWKTKPMPRFTESTITDALENKGIGRPSTYANITKVLKARGYIKIEKKQIIPTELGFRALEYLVKNFNDIFDVGYTAKMENELDKIAKGESSYFAAVKEIFTMLKNKSISFESNHSNFKPSEKQIALAEKLSAENNMPLPNGYKEDGKACKEFIDEAIKKAQKSSKPSEKQIAFAEKLSEEHGLNLPKDYRENAKACGDFIKKALSKNKNKKGKGKGKKKI